jgi:hypothetical protein
MPRTYLLHKGTCILISLAQLAVAVSQWSVAATFTARVLPYLTFLLTAAIASFVVHFPRLYWSNR